MNQNYDIERTVPFLTVANISESVGYYVDGLGFAVSKKWIDNGTLRWCWLERGGGALMLQEFQSEDQAPGVSIRGAGVVIYFICTDALAVYREAIARGIIASRPFVGNGMWVVEMQDPDGYKIAFESATDVPEKTVFDDHAG